MPEIAVRVSRNEPDRPGENIQGLIHIASVESDFNLYVWCWGETARNAWVEVPDAPFCLCCIAHGPRRPWRKNDAGILVREGPRLVTYDTETA